MAEKKSPVKYNDSYREALYRVAQEHLTRNLWQIEAQRAMKTSELPHHSHPLMDDHVRSLERQIRDLQAESRLNPVGPDLLTPMRTMGAKLDILEKALEDGNSESTLWDELFKRQGRFYIDEQALKEDPRLVMSVMCGVIPLRCEIDYARAQFDITAVSLYFKPLDEGRVIPLYELRFVTDVDPGTAVSFEWVQG